MSRHSSTIPLASSTTTTSLIFLTGIVAIVIYLTLSKTDQIPPEAEY